MLTTEDLEKAGGEGSRGGKIIGHTAGGKPVYADPNHPTHKEFTTKDHTSIADEFDARKKTAERVMGQHKEGSEDHSFMRKVRDIYVQRRNDHRKLAEEKSKVIEKSENDELEKGGKRGAEGEIRKWGNRQFKKVGKVWHEVLNGKKKPLPTADVVAHAENTSSPQLKKVSQDQEHHLSDAAKRELERRKSEKDAQKAKLKGPEAVGKEVETAVKKKSPKPVKYEPNKALSPHHKMVEKHFGKHLNKKFEYSKGQYQAKFGNVLNTDNARELSEHYNENRGEMSLAVHEPASAFIKKLYKDMLKEPVPKGKQNSVLFSAGGTGAGKTTGMEEHGTTNRAKNKAHIVYDTNMNTFGSSVDKIEQALAVGKKVHIVYTYRDPIEAYTHGAIVRAMRQEKEHGSGRTVPIGSHVATHEGSFKVIQQLKKHYADNKNVHISVIDNSKGRGNSKIVPISTLAKIDYIAPDELKKQLNEITDKLYGQGEISESVYRGFKAEGS